ncbi:MAG: hypothetical protein MJ066_02150 [Clostridia bacterium]|nr:hypothetical protein [Clostridia bacterium]
MNFTNPTTKQEMYATLQEIFHYYRISRSGYEPCELEQLSLPRLTYTALTSTQIRDKAVRMVSAKQEREKLKLIADINKDIVALVAKQSIITSNATSEIQEITDKYDESIANVRLEASKIGMANSSFIVDKVAQLESKKNDKIAEITSKKNSDLAEISSQLSAKNTELTNARTYYSTAHEADIQEKIDEINDAQKKEQREIAKYNNNQSEKEQKCANSIVETNATLQLRFMEISSNYFTKDQLIEMGYYEDVIRCVKAYYDTLPALQAFRDISSEGKLVVYLEDYYQNVVYMYQILCA